MNEVIKKVARDVNDPGLSRRTQLRKQINSARMEMEQKLITIDAWEYELKRLEERAMNLAQMKLSFDELHQSDLRQQS